MPKIINNLQETILEEAKKQLFANGYSKTTIRSVASACGIGVGTMYNYFASKEVMISTFMLEDWRICTGKMKELDSKDKAEFLKGIHDALQEYIDKYHFLFVDEEASKTYFSVFGERHAQLRKVIAQILSPICNDLKDLNDDEKRFLCEHIAESILFWTLQGVAFEKQMFIIQRLINSENRAL